MKQLCVGDIARFIFGDSYYIDFKVIFLSVRNGPSITHNLDSKTHHCETKVTQEVHENHLNDIGYMLTLQGKTIFNIPMKVLIHINMEI